MRRADTTTRPLNLLGLPSSLRAQSSHTAVLRTLGERVLEHVRLDLVGLASIPPYNEDCDGAHAPRWPDHRLAGVQPLDVGGAEERPRLDVAAACAVGTEQGCVLTFTASPACTGGGVRIGN